MMFHAPVMVLLPIWGRYVNFAPSAATAQNQRPITAAILLQNDFAGLWGLTTLPPAEAAGQPLLLTKSHARPPISRASWSEIAEDVSHKAISGPHASFRVDNTSECHGIVK